MNSINMLSDEQLADWSYGSPLGLFHDREEEVGLFEKKKKSSCRYVP